MMGVPVCGFDAKAANAWLGRHGLPAVDRGWSKGPGVIFEAMGFKEYVDVDINGAARPRPLSKPLDTSLHAVADLVVDAGTLEHIFDVRTAI